MFSSTVRGGDIGQLISYRLFPALNYCYNIVNIVSAFKNPLLVNLQFILQEEDYMWGNIINVVSSKNISDRLFLLTDFLKI